MRTVAIIQARMGSTRLPGKVLRLLAGRPVIDHVVERVSRMQRIDDLRVAVPEGDQRLTDHLPAGSLVGAYVTGSEEDVQGRILKAALATHADVIVRVTADCPLLCPNVADVVVGMVDPPYVEYASNVWPVRTFPDGMDVEAFTISWLLEARKHADDVNREHVTPWLQTNAPSAALFCARRLGDVRWTLDTEDDLAFLDEMARASPYDFEDACTVTAARVCPHCKAGAPHRRCPQAGIGTDDRETVWDMHEVSDASGVGLAECLAPQLARYGGSLGRRKG